MCTVYRLTLQYFRTHGPISSSALRAPRHFLVDLAVPVAVRLVDHLLELLVGHAFAQLLGHALQVFEADLPRFLKGRENVGDSGSFWKAHECVSVCLSVCLSIYLSISLSLSLYVCIYVYI